MTRWWIVLPCALIALAFMPFSALHIVLAALVALVAFVAIDLTVPRKAAPQPVPSRRPEPPRTGRQEHSTSSS